MVNLTDQELNEWVAEKVMGFHKEKTLFAAFWVSKDSGATFRTSDGLEEWEKDFWNPCENLNLTCLMEEKIREMEREGVYVKMLWSVLNINPFQVLDTADCFKFINATARQRCEACFLTFKD